MIDILSILTKVPNGEIIMKKIALIALTSATLASPAFAGNFAGFGLGVEASINKHDVSESNIKLAGDNEVGANLVGSYGFVHPNNLVSTIDAKIGLGATDIVDSNNIKVEQKQSYSVGYALGYTGLHENFMPYAKVNYNVAKLEGTVNGVNNGDVNVKGFGWGVGAKYKFTPNIEAGVEYIDSKLDRSADRIKTERDGHNINLGLTYRF